MKKTLIIFLIVITIGSPLFAMGISAGTAATSAALSVGIWATKAGAVAAVSSKAQSIVSTEAKALSQVGDIFNLITIGSIMNLHPFPASFMRYYDIDGSDVRMKNDINRFSKLDLISSDVDLSGVDSSSVYDGIDESDSRFLIANYISSGLDRLKNNDINIRSKRVGLITIMFAVFLTAEVLFYLVWGYVLGNENDEFPLRVVFVKLAYSIAIFFVVLALPFLIEMSRYAFAKITQEWFSFGAESTVDEPTNILKIPGNFVKQMAYYLDISTPSRTCGMKLSAMLSLKSKITDIIIGLVYLVFSFMMAKEIIVVALHILLNIIEVYILMTIVMFLVPFSLFTPLKHLGSKALNSLIGNLIECFVLLVLVSVFVPIVNEVTQIFVSRYDSNNIFTLSAPVNYTFKYWNHGIVKDKNTIDAGTLTYYSNNDGIVVRYVPSEDIILRVENDKSDYAATPALIQYLYPGVDSVQDLKNQKGYAIDIYKGNLINIFKSSSSRFEPDKLAKDMIAFQTSDNLQDRILSNILYYLASKTNANTLYPESEGYDAANQTEIIEYKDGVKEILALPNNTEVNLAAKRSFLDLCNSRFLTMIQSKWANANSGWCEALDADEIKRSMDTNTEIFVKMILTFASICIPCYFVKNSSMITNALMNGTINQWGHLSGQMAREVKESTVALAGTIAGAAAAIPKAIGKALSTEQPQKHKHNDNGSSPMSKNMEKKND